jgi:hypothetical protein
MSSRLIRLSGLAAILGGVLWIAVRVLVLLEPPPFSYDAYNRMFVAPLLLLLVGLLGLSVRRAGGRRRLARTGIVMAFAGCALLIAGNAAEFWLVLVQSKPNANAAYQSGAEEVWIGSEIGWILFLLGFLILSIGLVLFGVAAVRANELPRWRALPLMVGVAGLTAFLFGPFLVAAADLLLTLIGVGWILLGYILWSEKDEMVRGS